MNKKSKRNNTRAWLGPVGLSLGGFSLLIIFFLSPQLHAAGHDNAPSLESSSVRRVYAPYDVAFSESAIFWFGQVTPLENYADVRVRYNNEYLVVHVAVIDRRLWYDTFKATSPTGHVSPSTISPSHWISSRRIRPSFQPL